MFVYHENGTGIPIHYSSLIINQKKKEMYEISSESGDTHTTHYVYMEPNTE